MTKKPLDQKLVLALLDDSSPTKFSNSLDWSFQHLILQTAVKAAAAATATASQKSLIASKNQKIPNEKILRQRTGLKELMKEYNKPLQSKAAITTPGKAQGKQSFLYDKVEHIVLP